MSKTKKDTFIILPAGDFFVSFQSPSEVQIPIGLDRNNLDKSQYLFQNISGAWQAIPKSIGAVMIRPIVGGGVAFNSSALKVNELSLSSAMSIYPNPASDRLFFDLKTGISEQYEVRIFSLVGRLEKREILRGSVLDISDLSTGIYMMQIKDRATNRFFNHKFVVQK